MIKKILIASAILITFANLFYNHKKNQLQIENLQKELNILEQRYLINEVNCSADNLFGISDSIINNNVSKLIYYDSSCCAKCLEDLLLSIIKNNHASACNHLVYFTDSLSTNIVTHFNNQFVTSFNYQIGDRLIENVKSEILIFTIDQGIIIDVSRLNK